MKLTEADIHELVVVIAEALHPEQIVLFGSYGRGTATQDSDLDLLVVMESNAPPYKRGVAVRKLFWPPPVAMDILVFTPAEMKQWSGVPNHIVTEAVKNGRVLYAA